MRTHTDNFKKQIKTMGRELDSKIIYTLNEEEIVLTNEELNSISLHYEGDILMSVMKQLDIDSNVEIPINTVVNYQLGLKATDTEEFEYLNYGNYIVTEIEKQEDAESYKMICYDKMLYSMKNYEAMSITYPITVRDYIEAICDHLNLTFANSSDTFANYDKEIENELYLSADGTDLDYTFRDVLTELAQVTASTICINNDDELEIRYITNTVGKNLFDKNNANILNVYTSTTLVNSANSATLYIKCEPNTTYTISRGLIGKRFQAGETSELPQIGVSLSNLVPESSTNELANIIITTSNTAKYLCLFYSNVGGNNLANNNGYTEEELRNTIQIEKGTTATDYEEYGLDKIDEEFLKDVNVNFGEKFGPVNSIVLSRAGQSDNVYIQDEESVEENGLCEIKIIENQIMNGNDRDEFLPDILEKLDGLEYYKNDFNSTGICYYELCDKYNVEIGENTYTCIMFNDEINITQGLEEIVYTNMPDEAETDYKKADKTDRRINKAYLIVDKQNQTINGLVSRQEEITEELENNYYTKSTTDELILDTANGLINKYTVGGGNNIFRNTGLYFESQDYSSGFEFWDGVVERVTNTNSQSKTSMYLQNGSLEQKQDVVNNVYTVSFKYNQLNELATASVTINENDYELDESGTFTEIIQVNANLIDLKFECDVNNGYEIYELMVNFGETALNYSQNQNETKTDTVEISEGIKITSTTTDSTFKANADGIRVEDASGNTTTEFLDSGTKTKVINANQGKIANLLIQEIDGQVWLTGIGG